MKKQVSLMISLALFVIATIFILANNVTVPINFIFTKVEGPLILMLLIAILMGVMIAFSFSAASGFAKGKENKNLTKKIQELEEQLRQREEEVKRMTDSYQVKITELESRLSESPVTMVEETE